MEKEILKWIKDLKIDIPNIEKYLSAIKEDANTKSKIKQIYTFTKQVRPYLYQNGYMHNSYRSLKESILYLEYNYLPKEFIISSNPVFNPTEEIITKVGQDSTDILSYIANETRKFLITKHTIREKGIINSLDFANDCKDASKKVTQICNNLGIKSQVIIIYPGYSEEDFLYNGNCYHFLNIIYLNEKKYLVDCTYRQFFTLRENIIERIGIVDLSGCKPGIFMTMTESRKKLLARS